MDGKPAATGQPAANDQRRLWLALLGLVTLLGAAARLAQAAESLWLDELHTSWSVAAGPSCIARRTALGNQSPLYFYIAWAANTAWGGGEAALRSPSLAAGIAVIPCLALAVWRWTGSRSASLLAAVLAAVDRNCIFYAQEARPYACVQLLGLLHLFVFWRLLAAPSGRLRTAFVVGAGLLFYLHYTAVLLLAAEAACYAVLSLRPAWRPRYLRKHAAFDLAVAAFFFWPAVPHLQEIAARRRNWESFVHPWASQAMVHSALAHLAAPLAVVSILVAAGWVLRRRLLFSPINRRVVVLAVCWLAAPLASTWLLTYTKAACLFHVRYVVVSALAPVLLSSLCCACRPTRAGRWLVALGAVLASVHLSGMVQQWRSDGRLLADRNEDWRGAVELVNRRQETAGLPVLVQSGLIEADGLLQPHDELFRQYCLLPVLGIYRVDRSLRDMAPLATTRLNRLDREMKERIRARGGAWLLVRGNPSTAEAAISRVLRDWETADEAVRCVERRAFGFVTAARIHVCRSEGVTWAGASRLRTGLGRGVRQ